MPILMEAHKPFHPTGNGRFNDMNRWLKNILILCQIGGGIVGFSLIGRALLEGQITQSSVLVHAGFFFIFSFGIVAGVALIKKQTLGLFLSAIFQAIQIPTILTSVVSYNMFCGATFSVYWHETGYGSNFFFGSRYHFYLNSGMPWLLGINIIALILFFLLIREILYEASVAKLSQPRQYRVHPAHHFTQMQDSRADSSPIRHSVPGSS